MKRANEPGVSEMTQIIETDQNEKSKVQSWRLHVLIEAGYPLPLAEKIADSEVDLHVRSSSSPPAAGTRPRRASCSS